MRITRLVCPGQRDQWGVYAARNWRDWTTTVELERTCWYRPVLLRVWPRILLTNTDSWASSNYRSWRLDSVTCILNKLFLGDTQNTEVWEVIFWRVLSLPTGVNIKVKKLSWRIFQYPQRHMSIIHQQACISMSRSGWTTLHLPRADPRPSLQASVRSLCLSSL